MSRPSFASTRNLSSGCAAVLLCIIALAAAAPARAGIRDLVKKAKDKAAQATGKKEEAAAPAPADKVEFNDVILELTKARLERIVAAFNAASAASAGRPALVEKLNQVSMERHEVFQKNEEAIRATRGKRDDVEVCYHDGYQEAHDRRSEEFQQKALTDPAIREKFTRAAQEHNAAVARGDSAAIQKVQETMLSVIAPTHEDTLQVRQKCGPIPPRLAAEDKLDALDKQIASLSEQIRAVDEKVSEAQAEGGQLDRKQFAMAAERIQMYLAWRESKSYSKSATRGFTPAEIEALEKHLEQLRGALG